MAMPTRWANVLLSTRGQRTMLAACLQHAIRIEEGVDNPGAATTRVRCPFSAAITPRGPCPAAGSSPSAR